jgi:hypothetical protein
MPLFQKDPDKERVKDQARKAKDQAQAVEAFKRSPQGRARTARERGNSYFQIVLPVETALPVDPAQDQQLGLIEMEGWNLVHTGFVFQETGSVSGDTVLNRGVPEVTGTVLGIYVFKNVDYIGLKRIIPEHNV